MDTVQWHGTDDVDSEHSIELVSECGDRASWPEQLIIIIIIN